jgi:hypothetical protein
MLRSLQASRLKSTALFALVLTAGLQLLRVFFPSVAWYLKDTIGVESTTLALYALVVMNVGFLAAILNKFLGRIGMLWLTAGGIALARFIEQLIISPVGDLWISMLGCGLLALFLPIFISHIRVNGQQLAGPSWTFGLTLGLSIDSAIRGFTTTLDLSWISGPLPMIVVALLSGTIILLLIKTDFPTIVAYTESRWQENLAFLALGPYLIIQLIALQNQGWISEISPGDRRGLLGTPSPTHFPPRSYHHNSGFNHCLLFQY